MFVNAALSLCDALIHPAIEGERSTPPASPVEGESWLVAATGASGEFAGREEQLACREANAWAFAIPRDGMQVFDRSTGQLMLFSDGWRRHTGIAEPSGGATVDIEARVAIGQLISALSHIGALPAV